MAKLPGGVTSTTVPARPPHAQRAHGRGRAPPGGDVRIGSATFNYAGREYTLPLDVMGRHSIAPGLVFATRTACARRLLEYGGSDDQYLLLRVTVPEGRGGFRRGALPGAQRPHRAAHRRRQCSVNVEPVERGGTSGGVDCSSVPRAVLHRSSISPRTSRRLTRIGFPAARLAVEGDLHLDAARLALRAAQTRAGLLERHVPAQDVSQRLAARFRARAGIGGRSRR